MPQRFDETLEEFQKRRREEAEQAGQRLTRLYEFAPEPRDLYADAVTFAERFGVLRIMFDCSRPETDDGIASWGVPVARISFPFKLFKQQFEAWLASEAGGEATSE